jgi:multidrug efflux pump subunit AcrA (membrane-fusion protein)
MDRPEGHVTRRPEARAGPGADLAADAEAALWQRFAEAASPEAYAHAWLALQARMISGVAAGVVVLGPPDTGPFTPAAFWPDARRASRALAEAAERAMTERRGLVVPRPVPPAEPGAAPRPRYCVAYPILVDGRLHGVVAVDLAPREPRDLDTVLHRLQWGAAWLEVFLRRGELEDLAAIRDRLQTVFDLVASGFGQPTFSGAATAFATAAATRLGCDRVSLGFVANGRVHVRAVSHSARFGAQTNLVRAIARAMDEAVDQQATVVVPALACSAPRVDHAHGELSRQHGAGAICTVPLTDGPRLLGAVTFERPGDRPFDAATVELCEALAALAGPPLERLRRDDRWIGAKVGESALGLAGRLLGRGHLGLKAGVLAAAAVVAFLALATGEFRVASTAVLEPLVRQAVVAPFAGYVAEAPVRAGDRVSAGQLLAVLDDRDLRLARLKWLAQREQLARQHQQAMAVRQAAQVVILAAQMDQARAEVALLDDQLRRTRITAPFAGVVVTGDLSQSLSAPVERGQLLFEVAPLDAYRLVLQVDERDIGFVAPGRRGVLLLTGAPAEAIGFGVVRITPVSSAREGRNHFRVEADLEAGSGHFRPGMEGVGKVVVGERRLVWIWTRQVVDWVRLMLWRWLP